MSDVAVHCPHCGEAVPERDVRTVQSSTSVSNDASGGASSGGRRKAGALEAAELGVLFEVSGATTTGLWGHFFKPNPRLRPSLWLLDAALVVLTLPLIAGLCVTLMTGGNERNEGRATVRGTYGESILIALLGGGVMLAVGYGMGFYDRVLPWVVTGVCALALRVVLRTTATG